PYWVPRMTDKTSGRLVADLVSADRFSPGLPLPDAPFPPPPKSPDLSESQPETPPQQPAAQAQDNQPETSSPIGYALRLTDEEINALTALSPFVGGSPRRARRFVNV